MKEQSTRYIATGGGTSTEGKSIEEALSKLPRDTDSAQLRRGTDNFGAEAFAVYVKVINGGGRDACEVWISTVLVRR